MVTERKNKVRFGKWSCISVLTLMVFIILWILIGFQAALLVSLLILILALRIDARALLVVALVLLVICPFLLILQQDVAAKWLAEFSYFFLAAGVFLLFADHVRLAWAKDEGVEELPASDDEG